MKVDLSDTFDYIPEWNGNRDLPEDEQIVAHFKILSGAEWSRLLADPKYTVIDDSGNVNVSRNAKYFEADFAAICRSIDNIEGLDPENAPLVVANNGKLRPLYLELKRAYLEHTEVLPKK